ncbi:DUF4335 domain-containing protein [Prochlorococcus sp. MIT 1341]|uniref:DUF4335 domain-containing protein n=1 Tax=Prochlorococcus sp. MIT 1341 TaxID=3096221 RepID=UPI002A7648F5|nr:DUF4335 domain-containing protein [Prochlorococcus sp. MIT 1341]
MTNMFKKAFRYDQTSVRLEIEGFPDTSLGQHEGQIGIISSWKLELVGSADLEGKREHLQEMMLRVLPYARYLLSGVRRSFGDEKSTVQICSHDQIHQLLLRSSQPGVDPLMLYLDDAELSDLVRCLDELRMDSRVIIPWDVPIQAPLSRKELVDRIPLFQRLSPPFLGGTALLLATFVTLLLSVELTPETKRLDGTSSPVNKEEKVFSR